MFNGADAARLAAAKHRAQIRRSRLMQHRAHFSDLAVTADFVKNQPLFGIGGQKGDRNIGSHM